MGAAASVECCTKLEIAQSVAKLGESFERYEEIILSSDDGITGTDLLRASLDITEFNRLLDQMRITDTEHRKQIANLLRKSTLPPIRVIDFEDFKSFGSFPRYPDQKHLVTTLNDINRDESLVVFVSHCWLRGEKSAPNSIIFLVFFISSCCLLL